MFNLKQYNDFMTRARMRAGNIEFADTASIKGFLEDPIFCHFLVTFVDNLHKQTIDTFFLQDAPAVDQLRNQLSAQAKGVAGLVCHILDTYDRMQKRG